MILKIGQEICSNSFRYNVTKLLDTIKGGYREVYSAMEFDETKQISNAVLLIVYYTDRSANIDVMQVANSEAELLNMMSEDTFEKFHTSFDIVVDNVLTAKVIVTDMIEAQSLKNVVENNEHHNNECWEVFKDIVVGVNEISHHTNGGCHFGLSPENIFVYRDDNSNVHGLLRGMNFVCGDFDDNANLDKSTVNPAYRSPETHMRPFTPKAMQWSLALVLTYMLQRVHPWGLESDVSSYAAYSRIRTKKPNISIKGDLGTVLRKALSNDPSRRYDNIDDFVTEVMKHSNCELPISYECFGKPTKHSETQTSSTAKTVTEDADKEDNERCEPTLELGKEPKAVVKMSAQKGDGFKAVAGMSELKDELRRDFIDVIANRELATEFGIIPPGMLFYGPPGCGKTYLAEHLAQELGIDFSLINPSDLGSIYVHGSQKMIADLFTKAEKKAKSNGKGVLLIFDELESMVPSRKSGNNENQAGEVAEFLTRLNNSSQRGVYVIGLTNCLDKIDKAVIRKGRFDKVVYIDLPDFYARKALFEYELSKRPHTAELDLDHLATITEGYTSSDITYIVTESAREMFANTLRNECKSALNITQSVLENIVAKTRPSVTKTDLRYYEKMRDEYVEGEKKQRPSVGFNVG